MRTSFLSRSGAPPPGRDSYANQGLWTNEAPCESSGTGLPSYVLLGNDGRVLVTGYQEESKLKDLINAEIKTAKSAPKNTPPALVKAYADFNKGAYAAAISAANELVETPAADDKAGVGAKAKEAADAWSARAKARVERLQYMIDNALFSKADAEVIALKPAVKGLAELESKLAEFSTKLAAEDLKLAREAAKSLETLLAKVNEKGVDDKTTKDLKKLAEKYTGTKPGERAARLAKLLEKKPAS